MKKTILKVFCFVVLTVLAMCINTRTVRADVYTSSRNADMGTYASDTNYFTHSASGSYTTHTKWRYGLFDSNHNLMGAWCVQAHVQYIVGQTYETTVGYQVLDERKKDILLTIIKLYLETGEPVGSRTISKKIGNALSSATIRNEMSDLEELGYIIKPHTSAGRIPSDKGYRLYVNN